MASLYACCNSLFVGKNEFVRGAFTDYNGILAIFCIFTLAPIQASAFLLGPPSKYVDVNLQRAIKLVLKSLI